MPYKKANCVENIPCWLPIDANELTVLWYHNRLPVVSLFLRVDIQFVPSVIVEPKQIDESVFLTDPGTDLDDLFVQVEMVLEFLT